MNRILFSSDQLSPDCPPAQRFSRWRDLYCQQYGELQITAHEDRTFFGHIEGTRIGSIGIGRMHANIKSTHRSMSQIRADAEDRYCLLTAVSGAPIRISHRARETMLAPGQAIVIDRAEECRFHTLDSGVNGNRWCSLTLPRALVATAVPDAGDVINRLVNLSEREELRFVGSYTRLLLDEGGVTDPRLRAHVADTLVDLVALALGPRLPEPERAASPGLRAARLDAILDHIRSRYFDADYSVASVARSLKLSVRYVQEILQSTGLGFAERVLELRLQRSLALLTSHESGRDARISDVALACGFNDISYFHRSFRRRFGLTPASARGKPG
jgi:AraC-like DNA-binding protein